MAPTKRPIHPPPLWLAYTAEVATVSLGEKLKQLRKEKGWSQDELAFHAQIDGRQVSRYENDRVMPSVEVIFGVGNAGHENTSHEIARHDRHEQLTDTA